MSEQVKVGLEPYAALRAEIDSGEPLDAVIDREGITAEAWAASQAFWLKQMAEEAENQRFETTTRYQTLYRTQKKLLDADGKRRKRAADRPQMADPEVGALTAAEKELGARPTSSVGAMPLVEPPVVVKPVATPSFLEPSQGAPVPPQHIPLQRVSTPAPFPAVSSFGSSAEQPPAVAPPAMVGGPSPNAAPYGAQAAAVSPPPMVRRLAELGAMSGANPPSQPTPPPMMGQPAAGPPRGARSAAVPPPALQTAPPQPPAPQTAPPRRESSAHTMALDIEQLMASVVPFGLGDAAEPATAPPAPPSQPGAAQAASIPKPAPAPPPPAPVPQSARVPPPAPLQAAPPEPVKPAEEPPKKQNLMSTMMLDVDQLMAQATPFSGGAPKPREEDRPKLSSGTPFEPVAPGRAHGGRAEPVPPPPSSRSPLPRPDATSHLDAARAQAARPMSSATPQPFPSPATPGAQTKVASLAQTMVPDDDDPRTMMLGEGGHPALGSAAKPLPFGNTTVGDGASSSARQQHGTGRGALPFAPKPAPASPPASVAPSSSKIFSINQFASLTAEIAEHPENIEEVRRKYGVTESQHHAESQRWTEEFAMSSELRQRYFGIVARYREYLRKKP